MLSRRDKLYVQPWEERRYQDHRSKVRSALPAIDCGAPAARAHVALKLKKWQREEERARRVQRDNFSLLQRLAAIMRTSRLDNRWDAPLPNLGQKVGMYYDATAGGRALRSGSRPPSEDSYTGNVKCFACYNKRKNVLELNKVYGGRADSLPSI